MPSPRRRTKARSLDLTYFHALALLDGVDIFHDLKDDALRADIWWSVRDEWLPDFIEAAPGTRPWAWWRYEAPGPRRCVTGPGNRAYRESTEAEKPDMLSFGKPRLLSYEDVKNPSTYEPQIEFLTRHDLLTESEVAYIDALAASDDKAYREPTFNVKKWWNQKFPEKARR